MCLFTHFAAGALAGGVTGNVYAGAVAGLASHAVLDVIPHYDHPDWRLELAGGVLSLILLLLMPFASWPAVIGGLFGMAPDLENLFQKLGRMSRKSFIFPTHTGLLPHGRELGPRTLGWQVAIFVGCFVLLGLLQPGEAVAAGNSGGSEARMAIPVVQLLEQGQDRSLVRVAFPVVAHPADWRTITADRVRWGLPIEVDRSDPENPRVLTPEVNVSLAVPTRRAVVTRVVDVAWWREPDTDHRLNERLVFSHPAPYRSVPLTGTSVPVTVAGGILREVTLEIMHPAQGEPRRQLSLARSVAADPVFAPDPAVPAGILNRELFLALARGGREAAQQDRARDKAAPFDPFSLTSKWVRLELTETGVYRVTGQEMSNFGVATGDVDPAKLRVYRGGGLHLDPNPEVPDTLQFDRAFLNEVAIQVIDGGDGEWNLDDEIRFYGFGTSAWLDRFTPGEDYQEFYDHPYASVAVYWLTWESDAAPSPLPDAPRRTNESAAPALGGVVRDFGRARTHRERQVFDEAGLVEDNWTWDNALDTSHPGTFNLRQVVPDSAADFTVDVRGHWYSVAHRHSFVVAAWLNQDEAGQAQITFSKSQQEASRRLQIVGRSTDVTSGINSFTVRKIEPAGFTAVLDCLDIYYWARLDVASGVALEFTHPGAQVPAPDTAVDLEVTGADPVLWDVSDPASPFILTGDDLGTGRTRFGYLADPAVDRHFVALPDGGHLTVTAGNRTLPVSLRASVPAVDYLVVTAPLFGGAALELAAYRSLDLPGVSSPAAGVVSATDIYNNFSGGQKDPWAIRNYLRDIVAKGAGRLGFVCFLGNTSRDFRNYKDRDPDLDLYDYLPTVMRTDFPKYPMPLTSSLAYASDDDLVSFDAVPSGDLDYPDLATGRLPASNLSQARGLVERAIEYARDTDPGLWRNHLLFTADDCVKFTSWPRPILGEKAHTEQSEIIAGNLLPPALDLQKAYGVAYPFPPSSRLKPAMRSDINAALNRGTTIFYYVGHGAEDNLADEQIFQSSDIANLGNGMKRPLFTAFSCDVGVYDSPSHISMAEKFILSEDGGAIGSICASQVSFSTSNSTMAQAFFENLYPGRSVDPKRTVAEALVLGKAAMWSAGLRKNSQRYTLFADPGLRLPHPEDDLGFAAGTSDTLHAGAREQAVVDASGSKALVGPGDQYDLLVEESAFDQGYIYAYAFQDSIDAEGDTIRVEVPRWDTFPQRGGSVFLGNGVVGPGILEIPFKVPVQLRYGDLGRLRLVVSGPTGENSASRLLPVTRSQTGPIDDVIGPAIAMAFEDNRYQVRPGTPLTATLTDTSGIAILGTSPGNSLLLEFDDSGFMTDVTPTFAYEPNSFTSGRLTIPLPGDLSLGRHTASLHGSDVLGNVGSDTLSFEVAPEGVTGITRVTLFPNPTPGPCRLIFELSDPMEVQWDIYTTAGRRLKSMRRNFAQAGPRILAWDGLDDHGDEIANGTYLFVLRGRVYDPNAVFGGSEEGRDITSTGKLVIMR